MMLGDSQDCMSAVLPPREDSEGGWTAGGTRDRQDPSPGRGLLHTEAAHSGLDRSGAQPLSTEDHQLLPNIPGVRDRLEDMLYILVYTCVCVCVCVRARLALSSAVPCCHDRLQVHFLAWRVPPRPPSLRRNTLTAKKHGLCATH